MKWLGHGYFHGCCMAVWNMRTCQWLTSSKRLPWWTVTVILWLMHIQSFRFPDKQHPNVRNWLARLFSLNPTRLPSTEVTFCGLIFLSMRKICWSLNYTGPNTNCWDRNLVLRRPCNFACDYYLQYSSLFQDIFQRRFRFCWETMNDMKRLVIGSHVSKL